MSVQMILSLIRDHCISEYAEFPVEVVVRLRDNRTLSLPVPIALIHTYYSQSAVLSAVTPDDSTGLPSIGTKLQQKILEALDGRALRTDAIGKAIGMNSSNIFRPGGIKELQERGMVKHDDRVGFYRPDAPPPDLLNFQN